jgi:hypothetical protein
MAKQNPKGLPEKLQDWVDARNRHGLSHAQIEMARELGFQPKSLSKIDDSKNKPWKDPLPFYLESLYFKKFGRESPEVVRSIEEIALNWEVRKARQKAAKAERRSAANDQGTDLPAG